MAIFELRLGQRKLIDGVNPEIFRKGLTLISVFSLLSTLAYCQQEVMIPWSDEYSVQWNDFKGEPDTNEYFTAVSHLVLSYSTQLRKRFIDVRIQVFFNQDSSWFSRDTFDVDIILEHEQLHFDLAELYARKMRSSICKLKLNRRNYAIRIDQLFNKTLAELNKEDYRYDIETNFATDTLSQSRWKDFIHDALIDLSEYSEPVQRCRLKNR